MHIPKTAVLVFVTLVTSRTLVCQEIPRPDTLGANFDASTPGKATPNDFDYLIGRWKFRIQRRDPETGKFGPIQTGTWTATKTHEGYVVEDQFSTDLADGTHTMLVTYRVFDTIHNNWSIQGIAAQRGTTWQPGTGWTSGADRVMVQSHPDRQGMSRIRYYNITADHFLWRADWSSDGGKTWARDAILIEAARIKP